MKKLTIGVMALAMMATVGCKNKTAQEPVNEVSELQAKVESYAEYTLASDLINNLSEKEKQLIPVFIQIADIMDEIYWEENFGLENKKALDTLSDPWMKQFAMIQYGAWDKLDSEKPFLPGFGEKPKGANFYPVDMTQEEYDAFQDPWKDSQYSIIRRDENGALKAIPYHEAFATQLAKVDSLMGVAIDLAEDAGLKRYLTERRKAFQTDDYLASDFAWMDMKSSKLDFVVGPIENYDDALYGRKTSHESFILLKDEEWSNRLSKFTAMLPMLQKELPCDPKYKQEVPGTKSDLNVYDVIYYAGDCNAASKTIAINLPNDERVHLKYGTRRLQLKNAMQAKYEKIMVPIANLLISDEQLDNVKFDAFFSNVCYHEVAHGLGIKKTVTSGIPCREALGAQYSAWEEAKADICGLFLTEQLINRGEITDITVEDAYVTFVAGIFRSVRFGATEAHGIANMMCFNYFMDKGAFSRNDQGKYVVDMTKAHEAMEGWAALILQMEGDGDMAAAANYAKEHGNVREQLQKDLNAITAANIPLDIRYNQGLKALGL
ncbi:MAG: Zn-dependent hydrolase [Bacteroidales bacterium]|nr:Zn-dependent hydrolase [Bacteroidales bacterium]